jgi:hypothetical protein
MPAAPLRQHARQHLLRGQQQAAHVHGVDAVEVFGTRLQRPACLADAHVVVQHVDSAEARAGLGEEALHVGLQRHIADEHPGLAALGADQLARLPGRGGITVGHAHARALACVSHAGRAADAPAGAGRTAADDEDHPAREVERQRGRRHCPAPSPT